MLQTKDLEYFYNKDKVFNFPNISVNQKESLLLLGRSGIGKSTLLHLLGGLIKPSNGSVIIRGEDISLFDEKDLDRFRGQNIGIVFQSHHFINALTVIDNLLLAQSLSGNKLNHKRAIDLLGRLKLSQKKDAYPQNLSQGEKQRVAIARAVINSPGLILADEPTSALDDDNTIQVLRLLEEQAHQENAALVIVTHDSRLKSFISNQLTLES